MMENTMIVRKVKINRPPEVDPVEIKPRRSDTERLSWLEWALADGGVRIEETMAAGCRCTSCRVYRVSWEDDFDKPVAVEREALRDALDAAAEKLPSR